MPDTPLATGAHGAVDTPARLTIRRNSADDLKDRQVIFTLDGQHIGTLLFGHTLSRDIAPGPHTLRANNTLVWKTVAFDAAPGEQVAFVTVNRAARGMLWLVALVGVGPILVSLERDRTA